jgi:hypothetical protein
MQADGNSQQERISHKKAQKFTKGFVVFVPFCGYFP